MKEIDKKIYKNSNIHNTLHDIWKNRMIYTLLLPGIIWYAIFAYGPMVGLTLAFKTYKASLGIWKSPWCGFENYVYVFRESGFYRLCLEDT